eukprot:CAMPEP_0203693962 /NCGR_PEP_ID=MMETSP0091-20130426/5806_1 /ASSEMBLY_ACC=CAM_ASM_001089 /TAXON_ID=426623 /ORGANISM="Chaetoceros affinis, Strain CCMP159" /LENGTH=323 /DNA_ID=CAMNT_0050565185 /DNA_START=163 /DNA_END=1134 /DNA_ORIENTATION=-
MASSLDQSSWACDYCQVATFQTFEEACEHEKTCPMNQNTLRTEASQSVLRQQYIQDATQSPSRKTEVLSLSMPGDKDSLSDRQCYVRSHFVELFAATEADVASRHSKGAQKLHVNQIGIRCKHCTHFRSKDRAERAMCYPSSISRIYQTVADMQRFHFAACGAIPSEMKSLYKSLKTTRPRGVGSPQAYWITSAKELGLSDTENGIRYKSTQNCMVPYSEFSSPTQPYSPVPNSSMSSLSSINSSSNVSPVPEINRKEVSSPIMSYQPSSLPPLSPESQSTTQSLSHEQCEGSEYNLHDRDSEANMLLALKNARTDISSRTMQ